MVLLKLVKDLMNYAANDTRTTANDVNGALVAYRLRNEEMRTQHILSNERYSIVYDQPRQEREAAFAQYAEARARKYAEWSANKSVATLQEYVSIRPDPRLISASAMPSKQIYTKYL